MKVLWIDPVNSDPQFLNALAFALGQSGHEVVIRSNKRQGFDPPRNVSWSPFGSAKTVPGSLDGKVGWRFFIGCTYPIDWVRAVRFARSAGVKAVLVSTNLALPKLDGWAVRLLRACGILPVIIVHKPYRDFFRNPNGTHSARYKRFYCQAFRILVMNRYTQTVLQDLYELPEHRFARFPHPHFSELLSDTPVSVPLRNSLAQWARSRPVVSYFSSYSAEHSFDTFLGSLPLLRRLLPDLRILIVSRVQDDAISQAIEGKLNEMDIGSTCLFRWKPYSYSELLAYLEVTSVVVTPYKHATQSGVIPLAYGFGIPVVASNVGGLPEMVVSGKTGELVPPENPAALAEAIARVVAPEVLHSYREGAREFARMVISPRQAAVIVSECLSSAEKSLEEVPGT